MMRTGFLAGSVAAAVLGASAVSGTASAARSQQPPNTAVIVRLVPGADTAAVVRDVQNRGGRTTYTYRNVFPGFAASLPAAALRALQNNPNVALIEPDATAVASGVQSGGSLPWGLDRIDQAALPLNGTYSYPDTASAVTSYVVDTGVLSTHSEFTGRTRAGYSAISDGRGTTDCNGHGTHVAATVAGTNYGVAKTATTVPVRVLDCSGSGSYSGVIAGLDWIVADHVAGVPAVANLSLGGPASSTLDAALQRVIDDGVTVVVAAGNSNADACTTSPARVPGAITVAASDSADARASFSNFGVCVDVFAPGVDVRSAWYTSTTAAANLSGTSMAAPHVAGAVALLLGDTPLLTPAQVSTLVIDQSTPSAVSNVGAGTPNRLLRVASAPSGPVATVPAAPTNVRATAGRRSATVTWTPGSDGGSPVSSQTVHVYTSRGLIASQPAPAAATSLTVAGLKAGTAYTFRVSATNSVGPSPLSAVSNTVIPAR